ncbi:MAG TPA: molybdopterin-dependent oxidoreductase [Acetobacteraceae bacterium]|nr:molybdopterin-dependent oxidoreductase [Acetobacteraceae bacterium]
MKTTCPYCGVGCGVRAASDGIGGDPDHPANRGRLCVKGKTLGLTLDDRERLITPLINGRETSWDAALDLAAARFRAAIAAHGPDSVAFYVSGQFLTEDYYVANKLMKGFIGSANIDTNSRLCMASPVAAHIRAFGEDVVPGLYEDFEEADLILFVGSNAAWCHPVLFQRVLAARERRGSRIIVVDPRRSATAELADLHVPVAPGGDGALFAALLAECARRGALDHDYIARYTSGFPEALAAAAEVPHGVDSALFATLATHVAATPRMVTAFSQGVNQSVHGTDTVQAILNLHLATGRIGKLGAAPFSLTGQPNAMGGREVGGLATQLAAHIGFGDEAARARLARFWHAPNLARKPGLKAVDLFDSVHDGEIKALWIAGTNPAESMPQSGRVRAALDRCPFVVAADCWPTATTARAHLVLPASGWSEKDGTVTNSERMISRQRAFRRAPGAARPDWWMFAELGRRLGFPQNFDFSGPAAIFREHAALTAYLNHRARLFDLGTLANISDVEYDALTPRRWPLGTREERLFANGGFPTEDGRARFVAVAPPLAPAKPGPPFTPSTSFTLNTGRLRDQWHTMTRTGRVTALMTHREEAQLEIAPADAQRLDIAPGDPVAIANGEKRTVLPAVITPGQREGTLFAAIHWTEAAGSAGTINAVIGAARDPVSGQPAFKHGHVRIARLTPRWHGIALASIPVTLQPGLSGKALWSRTPRADGRVLLRFTGLSPLFPAETGQAIAGSLFVLPAEVPTVDYADVRRSVFRLALLDRSKLVLLLHLSPAGQALPAPEALETLFTRAWDRHDPAALFTSRKSAEHGERILCVCHQVSERTIQNAIARDGLADPAAIGRATRAGTGCGSCLSELKGLLREARLREPA